MKINITAEDYFRELELMAQQYGQEEDLYPWIYMLLQMVECKKKENAEKENTTYNPVSIRNVPTARYVHKNSFKITLDEQDGLTEDAINKLWNIRWELTKRVGPPDFAILDTEQKILGCVELKAITEVLFKNGRKNEECRVEPIDWIEDESRSFVYSLKYRYKNCFEDDKKIVKKIYWDEKNKCFEIKNKDESKLENDTKNVLLSDVSKNLKPEIWSYKTTLPTTETNQIVGHLDKYKRVLYTNGLRFYKLQLVTNNGKKNIQCEMIADLKTEFNNYKKCKTEAGKNEVLNQLCKGDISQKEIDNENDGEWTKLIKGLANIDWHEEPTVKITNTEKEKE